MKTIGMIGTGNMGSALIYGMLRSRLTAPENILVFDTDIKKCGALAKETGILVARDNAELVERSDVVILAVKPGVAPAVLEGLCAQFSQEKLLISIVLGLSLERLSKLTGGRARYVRCMPNTPALVGEGMTCIAAGDGVTEGDRAFLESLASSVGKAEFLSEAALGKVTALTGSSPAYIFVLIEAMADAAVISGLPRDTAYRLASQAVLGSAKMALETGRHPGELKDMVCSPAGSTIEAIRVLEAKGFRSAVIEAMQACDRRADEISNGA
ncbi:MAG: pyrroline-5-carboxylate reductase [Clostridiales bacterium]|jgi:pyrroline-5-carboxylate reductase|nr:pyrroline-5-carboxylate reductase [Clostridiales bacterium]